MKQDHINELLINDKTEKEIRKIIENNEYKGSLTWFLEDLGRFAPLNISIPILKDYALNSTDPVIQEGALYGLTVNDEKEEVRDIIYKVYRNNMFNVTGRIAWEMIESYHRDVCIDAKLETCICHYGDSNPW